MLVEADEILLDATLWDRALSRDQRAVEQLKDRLRGHVLHAHARGQPDPKSGPWVVVNLRQLDQLVPDLHVRATLHFRSDDDLDS